MFQFLLIVVASVVVWFGAGLVIQVASSLAHTLRISPFLLSFFVLGILTSLPEIMIAGTSISRGEPELMVGNL
ncbi:MAG: CaCA family Na(+)/Ca(+) antiporter, partial [Microgenomates group bacterium GW2011_GWC1_46_16]